MKCGRIIRKIDFGDLTYEMLVEQLHKIPKITLKELRYSDLYQPRNSCHGIYIIKSPDCKYYFGKATGRCIADRIGAHFDSRIDSFLNALLVKQAEEKTDEALHRAYESMLDWEFSVLFVEGEEDEELSTLISLAERMLIYYHNKNHQSLNSCKRKNDYPNLDSSLSQHIKIIRK